MPFASVHLGPSRFKALTILVAVAVLGAPSTLRAEVIEVELKDLAASSDRIVVATVSKIEDGPADPKKPASYAPKVATARVVETWKGSPVREVRYIASPSWACDTAHAEQGEQVVLFLERRQGSALYSIAHSGRGRMPLRKVGAKTYATLQDEVILPEGTPTISEKKTGRVSIPSPPPEPGKPTAGPSTFTFTYVVTSVEVEVLHGLVKPNDRGARSR